MNDTGRRIAICTGGGDAPGLNAVIRAVVLAARNRGWECYGIRDGYGGLLKPEEYPDGGLVPLTRETVRGITHLGGTILGTTNKGNPLAYPVCDADGRLTEQDRSDELLERFRGHDLDALVAIGGDGSLAIANHLHMKGLPVVGVPKTIDNDLDGTVVTFGFHTAVSFATQCLDRLHTTADAHDRVMVVEVMGRYAGWIALFAGVAGTADAILIPEIPFHFDSVARKIEARLGEGREFSIIVVAEGAAPSGGEMAVLEEEVGREKRLGGIGQLVADELSRRTGKETRAVVLGHLLRGGGPTAMDRTLALRFGTAAAKLVAEGKFGTMVALAPPNVLAVPLAEAVERIKTVPLDHDVIATARSLGISLGD